MDESNEVVVDTSLKLEDMICNVTDLLFSNNVKEMLNKTLDVIDRLQNIEGLFTQNGIDMFNQIINHIAIAMENKDYLFISDILNYELLPIIKRYNNGREINDSI